MLRNRKISALVLIITSLLLSSCGGFKIWPFSDSEKPSTDPSKPVNSDEYLCDANKKFYLRNVDKGDAVWLILADREVGLPKVSSTRYSNSITSLDMNKEGATLEISPSITYRECKRNPSLP